jgi:archaellum component FlaC
VTIDERLNRLVERHEALSQSVELVTNDVRELGQNVSNLSKYVGEVAEGTARLLHIAQIHE